MKSKYSKGVRYSLVLVSRMVLFLFFQIGVALILQSWEASQTFWLLSATLTNIVSIGLLFKLFQREGYSYFKVFKLEKARMKKDIPVFLLIAVVSLPVIMGPGIWLSQLLWDDPDTATRLLFQPLPDWLLFPFLLLFPVTIALAELATYFVYLMPRLNSHTGRPWLAILLPVVFLSLQHITLPFIPDSSFILYRGLAFLPFAALIGLCIKYRPSLFPYFAIFHGFLDMSTALMFLTVR